MTARWSATSHCSAACCSPMNRFPPVLKDAILTTEDQHFEEHWGVDFTRVAGAAWQGSGRAPRRRRRQHPHHAIGRHAVSGSLRSQHGPENSGSAAGASRSSGTIPSSRFSRCTATRFIFPTAITDLKRLRNIISARPVGKLNVPEAALLAGLIRGPSYSPILHPQRALARRNVVLDRMAHNGKITEAQAQASHRAADGSASSKLREIRWRRILSRKSANIWKPPTARKWCTSAGCACIPRSMWPCSGRQPSRSRRPACL